MKKILYGAAIGFATAMIALMCLAIIALIMVLLTQIFGNEFAAITAILVLMFVGAGAVYAYLGGFDD